MYRLVATTTQSTGPDTRVVRQRYDLRGNVIGNTERDRQRGTGGARRQPDPGADRRDWSDYGTTLTYDKADRLLSSTDPDNNKRFFYYDADGRLAYEVDPLGQVTGHAHDSHGRTIEVRQYEIPIVSLSGLKGGDVTAAFLGLFGASGTDSTIVTAYNVDDTVKQTTDPNGVVTTFGYNSFQEVATTIEAYGTGVARATSYAFDRRGLLVVSIVDDGDLTHKRITASYGHDAFGRAITLTNSLNKVATSTYDRKGRLKTETVSPDDGTTLYTTTYHY